MNVKLYSLGLMSGTSLDGIDLSIIKSDGEQHLEIIDNLYLKYDDKLKLKLKRIIDSCTSKDQLAKNIKKIKEIEKELTLCHADGCKSIIKKNKDINIDLIGFHGQTIIHRPKKGYSIQIGDHKLLSKITDKTVIYNFRENDILNGGQGAPLAPIYHKLILSKIKTKPPSAIINIGGISNITYVDDKNKMISFDTGPGNYLIDKWVQIKIGKKFDKDGLIAKAGKVNKKVLNKSLTDSFFKKKFPKSLDVKDFNLKNFNKLNPVDGCSTLSMLTTESICMALNKFKKKPNLVLLSGGGRRNKYIFDYIKKKLNTSVSLIDDFNFDGDFIESQAFAYLAIRSYYKKVITFPSTTGVNKSSLGGLIFKN